MGSFNVACSMSSISIGCGTKIAFIPLLPSEMNETIGRKYNKFNLSPGYVFLEPSANWVSNEGAFQFYKPFSLPIFGEYNDYGGIENIEENITAKAIKEYFGISVEEFVNCIGSRRSAYDYFSPIFEVYFLADKKLLSEYSVKFNEKWLLNLGFTKLEDDKFQFKNHPYTISLFKVKSDKKKNREAGFGYEILSTKDNKVLEHNSDTYDNREKFLDAYLRIANYYAGYKEEAQDKIRLLSKMSGMFVHREIYDFMSRNTFSEYSSKKDAGSWGEDADLNEDTLKKLGFILRCEDESIERYHKVYEYPGVTKYVIHCDGTWSHISEVSKEHPNGNPKQKHYVQYGVYHPNSLIKAWKELTGIEIHVDEEKRKESKFGATFDQIRQQYIDFLEKQEGDDDLKEHRVKIKEELEKMKTDSAFLKSKVDELKADENRLELVMSLYKFRSDNEDDEDDEFDEEAEKNNKETTTFSDSEIGTALINLNESLASRDFGFNRNPLQEPRGHLYLPLKPSYDKYNMLSTLYEVNVRDGSIRQDVIDFSNFYWNIYAMNKVLMPAANGYQCGCHSATFHLAKKTMEIMGEKIKEYEEEEA